MRRVAALLVLIGATVDSATVSPVSKVIDMLKGMRAQGDKEKEDEKALFGKFSAFCHDTLTQKKYSIDTATEQIEQLGADIQKYEADIAELGKEIEAHDAEIVTWTQDKKSADGNRAQEKKDYEKTHLDYSESIDALQRAISTLKKQDFKRAQTALVQVRDMHQLPSPAKRAITSLLAADEAEFLGDESPEAAAYEFQAGGIVDMLEKLLSKFQDERAALEKEEMEARHAFQMVVQDLDNQIDTASSQRNSKSETQANKSQQVADAKSELAEIQATKAEDERYVNELEQDCRAKTSEFEQRQQMRQEELEAIDKAIEIIEQQVANKQASFVQTSFIQLRATQRRHNDVAAYLIKQARSLNSRVLFQVASKVQEGDPLAKVKSMIQDLITRLMEEANEEAEHKGWCDTELASNEQTRKSKQDQVDSLESTVDKTTADIQELAMQLADLNDQITEIEAAVAAATEQRTEEKEKNAQTVKDAQDAQAAVSQALAVLKEFYNKVALVQQDPPATWEAGPYKGMQGAAGGVVGMLEVIQSDFARLEAETAAAEDAAAKEYNKLMQESEMDKLAKTKDIEFTTSQKEQLEAKLATSKQDLAAAQKELEAALAYYEKLKPSCVDAGVSYEDRVARRKEEIESLQEALRILSGDEIA